MKWVSRFKDKVGLQQTQSGLSGRDQFATSANGSFKSRTDHESELDFKRFWEEFRSSASDKEKEEALEMAVDVFCRLAKRTGNSTQLVNTLVDARVFSFVVAKALVTEMNKLRKLSTDGGQDVEQILHFFMESQKDIISVGANLLYALECLVSPPLDVQPLLDAGLLSCLVWVLHTVLGQPRSEDVPAVTLKEHFIGGDLEHIYKQVVERSIIHIMKALAQHPGATQSLAEDDSLQLLFYIVGMNPSIYLHSSDGLKPPFSFAQLYRQALQILGLLLNNDNGSSAQYIHKHQLVKVLLRVVRNFDINVQDSEYAVGVIDVLLECIELSCRGESTVRLRDDLHNAHGYHFLVQFALNLLGKSPSLGEGNIETTDGSYQVKGSLASSIKMEETANNSEGSLPPVLTRLLDILVNLAQVGVSGAKGGKAGPTKPASRSFLFSDAVASTDDKQGEGKVKDVEAVQILQDIFLKTNNVRLQLEILDRLLRIFASHLENYGLCQELRTIPLFILNMATFPEILQERLLKILEYAVTVVNYVPEQELLSLCCLLQQPLPASMAQRILSFFTKLLSFDKKYKKVLREVGALEVLVDDIKKLEFLSLPESRKPPLRSVVERKAAQGGKDLTREMSLRTLSFSSPATKAQLFNDDSTLIIAWDCLVTLLKNDEGNQIAFRKANGFALALPLLNLSPHRGGVLRLLNCLICEDINQSHSEELGALIEVAKSGVVANTMGQQIKVDVETKRDVLWATFRILSVNSACKDVFGAATGFSLLFTVLHSFQAGQDLTKESSTDSISEEKFSMMTLYMEVFDAMMNVVKAAVSGNSVNRGRLHKVISSQTFKELLRDSGLFSARHEERLADLLLSLALEKKGPFGQLLVLSHEKALSIALSSGDQKNSHGMNSGVESEKPDVESVDLVRNAGAIEVLIDCLKCLSSRLQLKVLEVVKRLARACAFNQDCLTAAGCVSLLLDIAKSASGNPLLLEPVLSIVEILGSYRLSSTELRTLARWVWLCKDSTNKEFGQIFLDSMKRMIHLETIGSENGNAAPFVEMSQVQSGYSCMRISLGDRTWPPTAGYSFACWLRYKNLLKLSSVEADEASRKQLARGRAGTMGRERAKFKIFSVGSAEEKSQLYAEFYMEESGTLALATSATSYLSFKGVFIEEDVWQHVVVVHNKPNALAGLFQSSSACLYVNGRLRQTGKLGYSASPAGKTLQGTIGTPPNDLEVRPLSWNLGTCYLCEEVLLAPSVFLMYALGRGYRGLFQDTDLLRFMPYEACGGGNLATFEALEVDLALGTSNQKVESSLKAGASKTEGSGVVWDLDRLAIFAAQLTSKRLIFCFDGTCVDAATFGSLAVINLVDPLSAAASPLGGLPRIARLHGDISICSPCGLGENIRKIGGVAVVLALVEAAGSKAMLHLALALLTSILCWSPYNVRDMSATRGYHLLALFLRHRMCFFEMQNLDMLFQIAACEASMVSSGKVSVLESTVNSSSLGTISASNSFESSLGLKGTGEGLSPFGSQIDSADFFQQDTMSYVSDIEPPELSSEVCNSLVLANAEMMEYVLLDWTLWVAAPVTIQLALLGFIERLVSMHRYRNHNLTMLRRVNIVQHLLVTLQRGDVEIPVLEKLVVLLGIILEDGFLTSELKSVVDFVVMTFEPPEVSDRSTIPRETMGVQVIVRNMLLEMLIDLQVTISSEEVLELWHKIVSSKLITFLLDEAVHPTSMRWVMTLLGVCLSSSTTFSSKFRNSGGFHGLVQVLPSFFDSPEVYYILFCLMFGKSVYPRQPEVRLLDFHALLPDEGGSGELIFTDFLEAIIAMSKAAFDRLILRFQSIEQLEDQVQAGYSIDEIFKGLADSSEQLQGEALLHKTYAARLLGGEVAAPGVVTSIIRYMVDLTKMCQPFSSAMRRQEVLESCVDFYFSCVRSAYAAQSFQHKALGDRQNSMDIEDGISSHLASSDSMNGRAQVTNVAQKLQEHRNLGADTVVSIPRAISSSKEINIIPSLEEDTLPSEDIVCDVNVFAMDSLDHLVALAAISAPAEKVEREEKSSSLTNADTESVGSHLALAPGSPVSEASGLLSGIKSAHSMSITPFDLSASFMGSSARSETHVGASSLATLSTTMSGWNSEVYYKLTTPYPENSFVEIKPEWLLKLDSVGSGGGPCSAASVAVLDLIAEVLADGISEQIKATSLVEAVLEAAPLYITAEAGLAFQGLCLGRLMVYFERRLLRDDEEVNKRLDKNKWSSNLDAFSTLLVDRVYMGAFMEPGSVLKILEFLLSMLQLANKDRRVEEATLTGKGLLSRSRAGRQVEGYVQSLLKNVNRMIMYCFTPSFLSAVGEDDFINSNWPRTDVKRLDDGDGGFLSAAIDICTVLQLVIANRQLIFCPINLDTDLVCCLCINSVTMLWDSRPNVRMLAVEVMKSLIAFRKPVLEELLVTRPNQGEALDVLHGGLDKLLINDLAQFYVWFRNSKEVISKVLEQCASIMWMKYVANATKFPGVRIKLGESRRKREMSRRFRDVSKLEDRHWEQMSERRYALDVVRDAMATELRVVRQDKYGWVLHAESEWEVHVQHLVHERGILPMLKVTSSEEPGWELCATEGPYRMRKKLVRIKLKVSMSSSNKHRLQLEAAQEDVKLSSGRDGTGLDITDPDYDSFFHLFSVGSTDQNNLSYSNKDFLEAYDDEDYDRLREEGSTSSSTKTGFNTPQLMSESGFGVGPGRTSSTFSAQTSTVGDFSQSHQSSPKQSVQMSEELKYEDGKADKDVNDDGEYLIRPFLEPGEKLRHRYNCERVVGLEKKDGLFLIGETCLYVIDNFFIDESGRICEKFGEDELSVIDQALGVQSNSSGVGSCQELKPTGSWQETAGEWLGGRAWAYNGGAWGREKVQNVSQMAHPWHMWKLENVHELLKRRYQLRPVAIELFSMDGCNELLVFHKNERDEVFKNLLALNLPRNSMLDSTISGASKQESNEGGRLFKMMAKSFSKRWQNGEISNFQYLMHLNTLAGRGYNDLTQYPVYPWVLADYESEQLNLNDSNTFRQLDKPMGALTPEREEEFRRRYESWDDPEIPSFHYGSHYSSAGTVLFYLIRLPPFSDENQKLQGGQFDHADRLFNSVRDTWLSASQGNTADVKELIPEFFYLPEMLENRFNLDFGVKQSGEKVGDVLLPPWANGSTREFIRKHREALESQYVSENLHHWIDLIFGYRQQGKAAVDATNVFFYLTYEGAVDIDSIHDPAMKASILAQINHFGQTPRQLFQKPHPKRKWQQNSPPVHLLKQHNLLVPQEIRSVAHPISQVAVVHEKVLAAGVNRLLKPRSYSKYIAWGFPDRSLRFFSYDQEKLISTHEGLHGSGQVQCAGLSKDGRVLVTGGEDGVVAIWRLRKQGVRRQRHLQLQRALSAHTQRVTCLAVCQSYGLVVSGSEDRSVIFWDLSSLEYVRQLPPLPAAASAVYANEMTGDVVTAAGTTLAVWNINGDCLASVNTSQLPSDTIVSVTGSCFSDWMETNWFITGHQSGSIKLWCMEHDSADGVSRVRVRSQSVPATSDQERWKEEGILQSTLQLGRVIGAGSQEEYHLVLFKVLKWHKQSVTCVHLTSDLKQLFSGDSGGHLVSWLLPDETAKLGPAQDIDDKS
ncbi:hypothetical protein GOP47_0021684 [Adiantum capillus-veneris]|uniref:Uncharacterized protein n=1 Tax=Adiantum capillus-veneris TaxID=13818 RepID=A0A9D4U899_ADICA|nr:hypothetical protein GOP47_0021684 [Adiantum capillus-veneris]